MNFIRCFVSIDIPREIQYKIKKIQDDLPEFYGKRTELNNLHLTLKFLGEIDEGVLEKIKNKLKKIKFKKFKVEIDSLGFFSEKFIRIIWLHIRGVENLQKRVDDALNNLLGTEERFMSHLTIARVKKINYRKRFLKDFKKIKITKLEFTVKDFRLKKSILKEKGPVYEDIKKYYLKP